MAPYIRPPEDLAFGAGPGAKAEAPLQFVCIIQTDG